MAGQPTYLYGDDPVEINAGLPLDQLFFLVR